MFKIFLCHRTSDAGYAAPHIYLELTKVFGDENVFEFNDAMPSGVDFRQHVIEKIQQMQVFILLIGANWVDNKDYDGQLRLQQTNDPVRIEIETALTTPNLRVIPVYLHNIAGPDRNKLPSTISNIIDISAIHIGLRPHELRNGVERLIDEIKSEGIHPILGLSPEIKRLKNELLVLEPKKVELEKIIKRKNSKWNTSIIAIPICLVLALICMLLQTDVTAIIFFLDFIIFITAFCVIIFGNPRKAKKALVKIEKEIMDIKSQLIELEGKRK